MSSQGKSLDSRGGAARMWGTTVTQVGGNVDKQGKGTMVLILWQEMY